MGIELASTAQASTGESKSPPAASGSRVPPARASQPATAPNTGKLMLFQTQAAPQPQVIRNPYVKERAQPYKQEFDLLTGDNEQADSGKAQLATWQQEVLSAKAEQAAMQPQISDEHLRNYYERHMARYLAKAKVRWDWMRLPFDSYASKPDAYAAAATLRQAAVEGEIAAVLQNFPKTELRTFDWNSTDQLPSAAIARGVFRMQPGEVSVIIRGADGVDVVRLIDRSGPTFEQSKEMVRRDLLEEIRRRATAQ